MIINTPLLNYPAISVIIPMYNAEKYIAECLESILAQTFQNFEVIVVDDCSTDSSCAIVENYIPKFGGRLILSHMNKNSGSGALPRNKGMSLSRGEYLFLMDNDDIITPTALEELYALAKNFNVEVVLTERNYQMSSDGTIIGIQIGQMGKIIESPTLETENLVERVQEVIQLKFRVEPWCKLVRRNLLRENEIFFPRTRHGDDTIWTWGLVFNAKKLLRVPNLIYKYRLSEDSIMRKEKSPQQEIIFWLNPVVLGIKILEQMMSRLDFFRQNPQWRYAILENFIAVESGAFLQKSFKLPPFEVYEAIKQEFGEVLGEYDVLISALCTLINTQQRISAINQQRFNEFAAQAQNRIAELEAQLKTK